MARLKLCILLSCIALAGISCGSGPETVPPPETPSAAPESAPPEPAKVEPAPPPAPPARFDPQSISQEEFNSTKVEVQRFIGDLNEVIRRRDYNAWKAILSADFLAEIASPAYLQRASESAALKSRNIVLKSPQDYFVHVVVPSRANSRVDDIEFIGEQRVKAFTINANGQRLRLYDLEHSGNTWLIIN